MRRFLRWWEKHVAVVALVLALAAGSLAFYFNNAHVKNIAESACASQRKSAEVWHAVFDVIERQSRDRGEALSPQFVEVRDSIYKRVDYLAACELTGQTTP